MAMIEVNEQSISAELDTAFEKGHVVILKFGSEWCDSCHALESELEDLEEDNENISVFLVDTDEAAELAGIYSVRALPTMLIYKTRENLVYRGEGVLLAQDIEELCKEA